MRSIAILEMSSHQRERRGLHVSTIAGMPEINVHVLDLSDPEMEGVGVRGIGEIGLGGIAPAITVAVYHAIGVQVRNLPVRIEDLLA
jgi:xanthine dehydrogenase YagR molybdenum-binding subunit